MAPPAREALTRLGDFEFPKAADDHLNMEGGFTSWKQVEGSNKFLQGEVDKDGQLDGKGIEFTRYSQLMIGNYDVAKKGRKHDIHAILAERLPDGADRPLYGMTAR